ncbi:MAG: hypothetical protein PV344_02945, partial [Anaplasma sp.]|nr:hypothetical protein [Anaplasma sp.]
DWVMTSQSHDLAREFQTTHNAQEKREITRGMKVIIRLTGRHMSEMISLYKVIHLPQKKNVSSFRRDSNPRTLVARPTRNRLGHGRHV